MNCCCKKVLHSPGFRNRLICFICPIWRGSQRHHRPVDNSHFQIRFLSSNQKDLAALIRPLTAGEQTEIDDVGAELTGELKKDDLVTILNAFFKKPDMKKLASEQGLSHQLFTDAFFSFRGFCLNSKTLPVDLHIVLSDINSGAGHVSDIFPYFLRHAREIFPHLDCMDDLQKISDLRLPANWYPDARAIKRKVVYHSGPTNSGKTHQALDSFLKAKSGVYCGPLRLLANEVFHKANKAGTPCDLVTGEERRFASLDRNPSPHVACTVEMSRLNIHYEVAIIDEIQMLRSLQRGWAWTRAYLGLCADELHVCGEPSAIELVKYLAEICGDSIEFRSYKRLTKLTYLRQHVGSFDQVRPGDCIVCFGKNDIYRVSQELEKRGIENAVIYGSLPPGTKLAQAEKFNDPDNPCKVLVATDAIGMGLNLNIRRIIFYSLFKPTVNESGGREMELIKPSNALQIGGRAGRFGTEYDVGEVTTFRREDINVLKQLVNTPVEPVECAGIHPTAEQIELFAYHLPNATLSNLIDIFVTLCQVDNQRYFLCSMEDFRYIADLINHVLLPLRTRYVFCCAPISRRHPFVCTMLLKYARQFSRNEPITKQWMCRQLSWPFQEPRHITDLVQLEQVFDSLDLYLWFSYRFPDIFPDYDGIKGLQIELDEIIQEGVSNLRNLLKYARRGSKPVVSRLHEVSNIDGTESIPDTSKQNAKKFTQIGKGRLADQLVKQGVLTKELLQQLQKELVTKTVSSRKPRKKPT